MKANMDPFYDGIEIISENDEDARLIENHWYRDCRVICFEKEKSGRVHLTIAPRPEKEGG